MYAYRIWRSLPCSVGLVDLHLFTQDIYDRVSLHQLGQMKASVIKFAEDHLQPTPEKTPPNFSGIRTQISDRPSTMEIILKLLIYRDGKMWSRYCLPSLNRQCDRCRNNVLDLWCYVSGILWQEVGWGLTCRPFNGFFASVSSSLDLHITGPYTVIAFFRNFSKIVRLVATDSESYFNAMVILLLMAWSKVFTLFVVKNITPW